MTTKEANYSIKSWLSKYKPDIIIIGLGGNDILQGIHPKLIQQNINQLVFESSRYGCVVLLKIPYPQHYPTAYINQLELIPKTLDKRNKITYIDDFFEHINHQNFFQKDGIHPNEAAQIFIFKNVWKHLKPTLVHCQRNPSKIIKKSN